jgi:divalent metal cation (Fe/Co/Zn/Cd) transporter
MLEWITLSWNVVAVVVLGILALMASSVALAGFGLDSLIEIGASAVVLWELSGSGARRRGVALRLIGVAFVALALYLLAQSTVALATGHRADDSPGGIIWTAVTAVLMFALAAEKGRVGRALGNAALETEGRVTFIDGVLAASVLVGIALDAFVGWWWADAAVGYLIVFYATREAVHIFREDRSAAG